MKILERNPCLLPYAQDLKLRRKKLTKLKNSLLKKGQTLKDFANAHHYFGFHKLEDGWVYREWAPGAETLYLTGDFCRWQRHAYPMTPLGNGVFELKLSDADGLQWNQRVMVIVVHDGVELDRIPLYATYVEQDPADHSWNCVLHNSAFSWTDEGFAPQKDPFIYECHIGMAQEEGKVGSYREFRENILPRIRDLGYNAIQIMAIMEHPYYASFGYQVTNFFAASSRFGYPEELKALINTAHEMGIAVLLDVVHSHASKNTREGINEFDGTAYQFFHEGPRGYHSAWDTKCFDYGKPEVLHFLLSNLKFWMEEYHFDGFRFDGVTSMLYLDHGLGTAFSDLGQYFSMNTDLDAVAYLQLATQLVHSLRRGSIVIAEDTSALPGLCLPISDGGVGFDYRLAMGQPDMWIRLLKEQSDESWDLAHIYYELTNRWPKEKVIGYCESHDQALVGDKTIMFRLCDQQMYWSMDVNNPDLTIDRGMALHKMLRLLTMSLGGQGYLTFMGNEFGHPEWIDFPREGNGWSYHYCRRQWHLADDPNLKYKFLLAFEKKMVSLAKKHGVLRRGDRQLWVKNEEHVLAYEKGDLIFLFNFDPQTSYDGYFIPMDPGTYRVEFSTDDFAFGGHGRVYHQKYQTAADEKGTEGLKIYLPNRTAIVLRKCK